MRAAYLHEGKIEVGNVPDPTPGEGQVLVRTHRCALCASDAHFLCSGESVVAKAREHGGPYATVDLSQRIIMGHEFVGEILDYGPNSNRLLRVGSRVTALPIARYSPGYMGIGIIGYQNELPGGFAEYMLLDEFFMMEVPSDLDEDLAALVEPLAVGIEHCRTGEPKKGDVPLVLGCGAIGLSVIAGLKLLGIAPIVASDPHAGRRALAIQMGAHVLIDPSQDSPYLPRKELGGRAPNLVYECVGKQGLLNESVSQVGELARIVMGGFCLEPESVYVPTAQLKGLKIIFARGETPEDMAQALKAIHEQRVDLRPWLGARIGLHGVDAALRTMLDPASPVRTIVDPRQL